jgi:AAA+ ATPase superfamily predicted ATPase
MRSKDSLIDQFLKFSLMGGIPRYWQYAAEAADVIDVADCLFFGKTARLEDEPDRILRDEDIFGLQSRSILESIGRGSSRSSEISGRLGIPQTGLSKPLAILMNANLVTRVLPFGESPRNSKRTLYRIADYALRFWYQVYSPHRTRWYLYGRAQKLNLIKTHAGGVLEDEFRKQYPDACPYWEGEKLEFDSVRFDPNDLKRVIISEIKLGKTSAQESKALESAIELKFKDSLLGVKNSVSKIEVLSGTDVLRDLLV